MVTTDRLFDTLRDILAVSNPGLVTKDDVVRMEERLDELTDLVDEIEERLSAGTTTATDAE